MIEKLFICLTTCPKIYSFLALAHIGMSQKLTSTKSIRILFFFEILFPREVHSYKHTHTYIPYCAYFKCKSEKGKDHEF